MQRFKPDFIALVKYFLPEEGGRQWPVHSGYQPVFLFDGCKEFARAENIFTDREYLQLGETATTDVTITASENFNNMLFEGQRFEIYEPPRHIGSGVIRRIANKELEKNSRNVFIEMTALY
jgi:translation elongation factor EF-Tu-like GTPase